MTQVNQHVTIYRGNDRIIQFTCVDGDGLPKNLTDSTIVYYIAQDRGAPPLVTKTVGSGIAITNAVGGLFTVTLSETETDLERGKYQHWAVVTDNVAHTHTVTTGNLTIA